MEKTIARQTIEALGSSLDIGEVLAAAFPLITKLVPAEYAALGVSPSGRAEDYQWTVANLPSNFFAGYSRLAEHDFVRRATLERLGIVLRDADMIERSRLEANPLYRVARDVGTPIEQVAAVMANDDAHWQGGLSLYREARRPFSEADCARLQQLVPALRNAIRNCQRFREKSDWSTALNAIVEAERAAAVVFGADGREMARTTDAQRLIEKYFVPHERSAGRLPDALLAESARASEARLQERSEKPWKTTLVREGAALEISCHWPTDACSGARVIFLRELVAAHPFPPAWRELLTNTQQRVVAGVLRGWDNRLVAEDVGCSLGTVKKHLQRVFDAIGVPSRAALIAKAAQ